MVKMNNFVDVVKIELKKRTPEELTEKICELTTDIIIKDKEIERLNKEKSILEKSLKLIWKKDIKIDYEELDKANKDIEKALKEGKENDNTTN